MKKILCFLMLVAMISCATDKKSADNKSDANTNAEANSAEKPANLTLEDAKERKERVSTVSYDLDFDLTGTGDEFSGTVAIEFDLKDSDEDLRVDFNKGKVSSINVNGVSEKIIYDNIFISIPSKNLKEGYNKITINFIHDYSKDGSGLYKYIDEEDKRVIEVQSVYILLGTIHRMEKPRKARMVLIEQQIGTCLGEHDIIRYQDVYARN